MQRRKSPIRKPLSPVRVAIYNYLKEHYQATAAELTEALGFQRQPVKDALYRATLDGELVTVKIIGRNRRMYRLGTLLERLPPAEKRKQYHDDWQRKPSEPKPKKEPKPKATKTATPKPKPSKPVSPLRKIIQAEVVKQTKKWEPPKQAKQPEIIWPSTVKVQIIPTTYTKLDPRAHIR